MATLKGIRGLIMIGSVPIGEVQNWTLDMSKESTATGIINSNSIRKETGAEEASGSISCYFDPTDTTGQQALYDAYKNDQAVTLNLYTGPVETGTTYYSLSAVIPSISLDLGGATGRVTRNFTFESTSEVDELTVA